MCIYRILTFPVVEVVVVLLGSIPSALASCVVSSDVTACCSCCWSVCCFLNSVTCGRASPPAVREALIEVEEVGGTVVVGLEVANPCSCCWICVAALAAWS